MDVAGVRLREDRRGLLLGQLADAAEDEPRSRRARARQGRPRRRCVGHARHGRQGPAARLQQGSAGDAGAALRRRRDRARVPRGRARDGRVARVRSRADARRRSRTATWSRPSSPTTSSRKGVAFREAHDVAGHLVRVAGDARAWLRSRSTSCARRTPRSPRTSATGSIRRAPIDRRDVVGGPARAASACRDRAHRGASWGRTAAHGARSTTTPTSCTAKTSRLRRSPPRSARRSTSTAAARSSAPTRRSMRRSKGSRTRSATR